MSLRSVVMGALAMLRGSSDSPNRITFTGSNAQAFAEFLDRPVKHYVNEVVFQARTGGKELSLEVGDVLVREPNGRFHIEKANP
jgi:hypothetical protein